MASDRLMRFAPEQRKREPASRVASWTILVVDDEPSIIDITRRVLDGVVFEGRGLHLMSASSAREARGILESRNDIAVILLDVVMEEQTSGLELTRIIRQEMENEFVRIILRTGQPGQAPESSVILDYDINDYREKTDLSSTRLITSVIAALRDYSLLSRLNRCLVGMETAIESMRNLLRIRSYQKFAEGLLEQVLALLNLDDTGLYADVSTCAAESLDDGIVILAGTGDFSDPAFRDGRRPLPPDVARLICQAVAEGGHLLSGGEFVGYIPSVRGGPTRILYLRGVDGLDPKQRRVIEAFLTNVGIAFDTVTELEDLHRQVDSPEGGPLP